MNKTRDSGLGGIPFAQRPVTGHGTAIAAALRSYKDFQQNSVAANKIDAQSTTPQACYVASKKEVELSEVLKKAANRAIGGGVAGAAAMAINVSTLMWIRTTVNFQYRYGMSTSEALRHLYKDGGGGITGLTRFYRGYFPALMQGPLARFGDTAANAGVMAYFDSYEETQELPVLVKTLGASAAASGMRIFLMPIDAWKTTKQVEGAAGLSKLVAKVRTNGPTVLWHGALGAASATFVGHYPWWSVYNALNEYLPQYDRKTDFASYLGRSALIGFCASVTSDSISNPIRVLKTYRQTSAEKISYAEAAKAVIAKEGFGGFWTRGLSTKIVANGLQGIMFSVGYKYFTELIF
eukprot:CAMPEP_0196643702 /NCGR_PEP_ID=MMETSP1085-20130531/6159_1 /TAXON_ID=41879 ORGANISM="Pycnococcus sp, Strain CCMP1998" /NCGR_SAMPLE_ID=MMETSP1085 /ASSEMBLY_ACC=CAM_ASM_000807 /LENGTH=350 /DNA_ID=CAMNT_0041973199 /DNA_START=35 /DNA_END=1084 /DNA_ORIENTATION=-